MIKALIFDFDNTVADTLPIMRNAVNDVLRESGMGASPCQLEELLSNPPLSYLRRRGLDRERTSSYWVKLRHRMTSLKCFSGIRSTLSVMNGRIPMGLQTSLPRSTVESALRTLGLQASFTPVLGYHDVPRPKPAPDGIQIIADGFGVEPEEVLAIGDSPNDILAAQRAGAGSALTLWSRGDPGMALFLQPTYSLERPGQILALVGLG